MKKTFNIYLALMLMLGLVLGLLAPIGCQQGEVPSPSVTPPATPGVELTPTTTHVKPGETPKPAISPSPKAPPLPALTPLPTPKPEPGLYRNTTYGFAIRYSERWAAQETGGRSPIVRIGPSGAYPVFIVNVDSLSEVMTPEQFGEDYLGKLEQALNRFSLEERGGITLGDATGYKAVVTWVGDNVTMKAKFIFVVRGSQAFEIYGIAPRSDFDRNSNTIDEVVYSFRLEEPRPFGVARSQALTLYDSGPTTLDPAISRESSSHAFIVQLFGGLAGLDKDLRVVPDIAERWEVGQGGRVYTFYLRKGAKFHNGREVTANDFKYSWERAANPKTKSPTVETYLGDIVGVKDVLKGKAPEIQGVKVVDDYTLQVTIDAPKAYFLSKLTYPTTFVVDRDNVDAGPEWWRRPNGTGPFRLLEWKKDELFILGRNDLYHLEKPRIGNVVFRLYGGRPMTMYETGEIDIASVYVSDIDKAKDPANPLSKELRVFTVLSLDYIAFSTDHPPFDDPKVRQAFSLAVDKDKVIDRVLKNMNSRADGILPPGIPGYNPDLKSLAFDVKRARELIAESKYGSVAKFPPIAITVAGSGGDIADQLAAIIQEWKQNLGVQVTVRQLDPDTYSYIIKEERNELTLNGWIADYPDPENFLDVLFHSGSQANDSGYSNPEIDALLEKARVEQDSAKRLLMYQEIEQKLVDDAAVIPMWFGSQHQLVRPYVKGYELALGYPALGRVSLEPH